MSNPYFIFWSAQGNLFITKVPEKARWKKIMTALTPVAHYYDTYKKDVMLLEGIHLDLENQDNGYANFVAIYNTKSKDRLKTFDLWALENSRFRLIRTRD